MSNADSESDMLRECEFQTVRIDSILTGVARDNTDVLRRYNDNDESQQLFYNRFTH